MGKKEKKLKKSKLSNLKKASTKKKLLIGGGIAAIAVAAGAGGLYLAKRHKKNQQGKLLGGNGSRDISSMNAGSVPQALVPYLGLQENKAYLTNVYPIPLTDAITIGLGWDSDYANVNLDLLASVFDAYGKSLGYVHGSQNPRIFNGGVSHSGDDVAGSSATSAENSLTTVLGDNEHVSVDFRLLPPEAASIIIGVLLVSAPNGIKSTYVNVLPLLRADSVGSHAQEVEYDSDDGEDSSPAPGSRGIGSASNTDDGDDELILLFKSKLEQQHPDFQNSRGYIAAKIERSQQGGWQLQPIRQVVNIDPNYGLWPSLEYYSRPPPTQQGYGQQGGYAQQGGYGQQGYQGY